MNDSELPESFEARRLHQAQRGINGNGMGLPLSQAAMRWPTPNSNDGQGKDYTRDGGDPAKERLSLGGMSKLWATPKGTDGAKGGPNQSYGRGDQPLPSMAAQWPTPTGRDSKNGDASEATLNRNSRPLSEIAHVWGQMASSRPVLSQNGGEELSPAARTLRRRLNPAFGAWLMGWPTWWTNPAQISCAASEMALYHFRLQQHLSSLCGEHATPEGERST